ncbi:hypothetical protein Vadar_007589 [Vaccinium darrowii]|uniref:Uncharacterized protein n=1 Tax=Vaccinium darrowii TaxID=229202 RepID=A0ACB7XNW1_9ERIC|nr:hypothetical protein Vadar_007589 [Vaccinium darrowii]
MTIFEGKDKTKEGTTLLVRPPLTGPESFLVSLPKNLTQLSSWSTQIRCKLSHFGDTSVTQDPDFKALVLLSSTHDDSATPDPFTLLGHWIRAREVQWNILKGIGELSFVVGYWEWTEDILSRHGTFLKGMRMYDAVFASLFTYDRHPSVLRAFLECWCSSTNSMHSSIGEVSISLWDLQNIGRLPIAGQFYDEVVPSAKEFSSKNPDGSPTLLPTCQYLFLAYHRLCKGSKGVVKISAWVDFWFKGASKHKKLVNKAKWNKTMRQEDTFNPSGKIPPIQARKASEQEVFDRIGVERTMQEKTYLAAFLIAWLCKFMLPLENATVMRPGVFRIASKMAKGDVFCLAAPVLASIYRGLNETISSLDPTTGNVVFPAHYLYGGARHFDDLEAQTLFKSCKGVVLHHLAMKLPQRERRVDDSPNPNVHNLEYLFSIRSCYSPPC